MRSKIPQSLEAEQAVLGSLLIEPQRITEAIKALRPSDFYLDAHRFIYEAIVALHDAGKPIELWSVREHLEAQPIGNVMQPQQMQADLIGNTSLYLANLMEAPSSPANLDAYMQEVKGKALRRLGMEQSRELYFLLKNDPEGLAKVQCSNGHYHFSELLASSQGQKTILNIEQAGAFLSKIGTPPPFLIEQLIPEKSLILCAGKPKHAKSLLALDIAHRVSQGKDIFGCYRVNRPGPVIYFSMEDSQYTLANRMIARGIKATDDGALYVCTQRFKIGSSEGIQEFRRAVIPLAPVLVIVDTAAVALGIADWSNRSELETKMAHLRDFSREVCSVLLVAHNRKAAGEGGDEIAGTNAFAGAVDGWLSSSKKEVLPSGNLRVFYTMEGRDIRGEFVVEMDTNDLCFSAQSKEEIQETNKQTELEKQKAEQKARMLEVCQAIDELGGRATQAAIVRFLDWTQPTVHRLLKEMLSGQHVRTCGESREGTRGPAATLYEIHPDSKTYSSRQISIDMDVMNKFPASFIELDGEPSDPTTTFFDGDVEPDSEPDEEGETQ